MLIRLHNTLTQKKELFVPYREGEVRMYVCGPTVYDELHIGNFRCFVVFETLARFLRSEGFKVTRVQNFTDIDDKMIRRADELGVSVPDLAERYVKRYEEDAKALGMEEADQHPRATEHVPEIIALIETLLQRGKAYVLDGDVVFSVTSFPDYGKLSHQSADARLAGARVDVDERKHHPGDFVLWKAAKPGEPHWSSPWGDGRPGWHIECSAMAERYLGLPFDIHAGGQDLVFPHHENEIAQSEAAADVGFARYWVHNAMLTFEGGKMSKSLGNIKSMRSLRQVFRPAAIRMFLLSAHYRTPLAFSEDALRAQEVALERIENAERRLQHLIENARPGTESKVSRLDDLTEAFLEAMRDDLNTADAMAAMFDLVRFANSDLDEATDKALILKTNDALKRALHVLGIASQGAAESVLSEELQAMLDARQMARARRDFAESDRLRDALRAHGILVEDTASGARWHRV